MPAPSRSRAHRSEDEPSWSSHRYSRSIRLFPLGAVILLTVAIVSGVIALWLERRSQIESPYVHSLEQQIELLNRQRTQDVAEMARLKSQLASNTAEIGRLRRVNSSNEERIKADESLRTQILQLKSEVRELRKSLKDACEKIPSGSREPYC
jgi:septal ring factor EnvC (AmiA/AmiB activator)